MDPKSATLEDGSVFSASNKTGIEATRSKEYGFREAYGEKDFSGASVADRVGQLQADRIGLKE